MRFKEYKEGIDMNQFQIVKEISSYNHNYYHGLESHHLLFGNSDDDRTTEWYLIVNCEMIYLGESYVEDEKLGRHETRCT